MYENSAGHVTVLGLMMGSIRPLLYVFHTDQFPEDLLGEACRVSEYAHHQTYGRIFWRWISDFDQDTGLVLCPGRARLYRSRQGYQHGHSKFGGRARSGGTGFPPLLQ
jgi:hypothetical protein